MSLGYGYDMVLSPRHPTDHDYELSQPGRAVRRYRRSRRARTARRRSSQCSHHHRLTGGDGVPHSGAPQSDADIESLGKDLCRMSLTAGKMPMGHPITPSSGATSPPPGLGSTSLAVGTMPPWALPYGLNTVIQGYASSISTNMGAYEELSGHHIRSALDLVASAPVSEYRYSTETPGLELHAIASRCYNPRDR
jgi:hypothetical protein